MGEGGRPLPAVGVDLGGTKLAVGIVDEAGRILKKHLEPTNPEEGSQAILTRISKGIEQVWQGDIKGIGIGCPGTVDASRGEVIFAPNLGWRGVSVGPFIQGEFKLPVVVDNDANAAAVGELKVGGGQGCRNMIYLTVSTGIGAGIIIDGEIYRGFTFRAGEVGHMVLAPDGPLCSCGNRGCLEAFASGTSIARMAMEAINRGLPTSMRGEVDARMVAASAREGDQLAKEILTSAFRYLSMGIGNLLNIFDPELIIIGGGLSAMGDQLLQPVREGVVHYAWLREKAKERVVLSKLGQDIGLIGAASLVL